MYMLSLITPPNNKFHIPRFTLITLQTSVYALTRTFLPSIRQPCFSTCRPGSQACGSPLPSQLGEFKFFLGWGDLSYTHTNIFEAVDRLSSEDMNEASDLTLQLCGVVLLLCWVDVPSEVWKLKENLYHLYFLF